MAKVMDLSQSPHGRCEQLLPWFVNGTLTAAERTLVEQHVAECRRCAEELERVRALALEVREIEVDPECDQAFLRLATRLDGAGGSAGSGSPRRGGSGWWRGSRAMQALVAGQTLVIAMGAAWLLQSGSASDAPYRTLSDGAAAPNGRLFVTFDASRPEQDVRAAILAAKARVVDGPTAEGLYVLESPVEELPFAVDSLRRSEVVAHVDALPVRQ